MQKELFTNNNTRKFPKELILLRKMWINAIKVRRNTLDGKDMEAWHRACKNEMAIFDRICRKYSKDFIVFNGIEWWLSR